MPTTAAYDSASLGVLASAFKDAKAAIELQRPMAEKEEAELGRFIISIGQDGLTHDELVARAIDHLVTLDC